jgi:hypothetical protein
LSIDATRMIRSDDSPDTEQAERRRKRLLWITAAATVLLAIASAGVAELSEARARRALDCFNEASQFSEPMYRPG